MDRNLGGPSFANVLAATRRDIRVAQDRTSWRSPLRYGGTAGAVVVPGDSSVPSVPGVASLDLDAGSWSAMGTGRLLAQASSPNQVVAVRFELEAAGVQARQTISYEILDAGVDLGAALAINFTLTAAGPVAFRGFITATDPNNRAGVSSAQLTFVDLLALAR